MKNYKYESSSMNWPWCESPFFYDLLNKQNLSDSERDLVTQYHEEGYCIIDLGLSQTDLFNMRQEIDRINNSDTVKLQDSGYHYSKGKRIFEAWKSSDLLKSLSLNSKILDILNLFYQKKPIPFQTITFNYGSNQPLHSDTIHFHSLPHRWLVGAWVALEDMDENNGSLIYVPKSHKLPVFDFYDLNVATPKFGEQFEAYSEYENFMAQLIDSKKLEKRILKCKAGSVLIWAANLVHGGDIIRDTNRSRYSQVTHYYFDGCDKYYAPMFSEAWKGSFSEKNLKEKNFYV